MATEPNRVGTRRKRAHAARRARVITGVLSAATAVGLTGGLMASHAVASSARATTGTTASQSDDSSTSYSSTNYSAAAAAPAQVATTSSHGS